MVLRAQLLVPRRRHAAPAVVAVDFAGKKPTKQPSRLPRCFKGQDIKDEGPAYALPPCFFTGGDSWVFLCWSSTSRVGQDSPAALSGLHFRSPAHNFKEFGSSKTTREGLPKKPRNLRRFLMHVTASLENVEDRLVDRMISSNIRFDVISWIGIPCFLRFEFIKFIMFIKFTIDFFLFGLLVARIMALDLGQLRSFSMFLAAEQESPEVRYKGQLQAWMMGKKINALLFVAWKDCGVCLVFSCCFLRVKGAPKTCCMSGHAQYGLHRYRILHSGGPGQTCGFVAVPKINSYQLLPTRRVRSYRKLFLILYTHRKSTKCITERCFFFGKWRHHVANQGAAQLRWQHEQSSGAPHGEGRTVGGGDLRWESGDLRRQSKACHLANFPHFLRIICVGLVHIHISFLKSCQYRLSIRIQMELACKKIITSPFNE